jgi:sporulation protein YlmC with PRC-barrel domain
VSADPVSWLLIEPGWEVYDANGKRVGKVKEVLGEREADIWDGLRVNGDYVPAEDVAEIVEGRITLSR